MNGTIPRKPTSTNVCTNILPVHFLPFHTYALIFCFTQAFSSNPSRSPLLLLRTALPTSPFSPCPNTTSWAPTSCQWSSLLTQQRSSCRLGLPPSASLTLPLALLLAAPRPEFLLDLVVGERMCTTVCLGEGFTPQHYSPQSQPRKPKTGQKQGSQRIISAAGAETGHSLTYPDSSVSL